MATFVIVHGAVDEGVEWHDNKYESKSVQKDSFVMHEGTEPFDNDRIFESYQAGRHRPESPNESLEKPIFLELLGDVRNKQILDLGCAERRGMVSCISFCFTNLTAR